MQFRGLLVGLGLAVFASGAGPSWAQAPKSTVVVGMDVDAGTLDPRKARDTTAYRATDLIYDGLVQISPDLKPVPDLAASWDNPDPTTFIFHLRDGVKFQDGQPLTAADVVYTFQTILDPTFGAPQRALYVPIKSVEAVDAKTVKMTLTGPYAPLLSYLDMGIVPKHAVDAGIDIGANPIGTGPMKLTHWERGARLTLDANTDYWAGAPAVKEIQLAVIGDNTARAQAFEAGDLDFIQSPLSPQDISRLQANSKFSNAITSGIGVTYLNFNTSDPVIADPAMRRAIAMVVDQPTIVGKIYNNVDKAASSILLPSSWAYTPDVKQPTFDLDAAKKAFAALGYKAGTDGSLAKDGKKLSLTIATHSEDPNRVQTVEYLQGLFSTIGIDVQVKITDFPTLNATVQASKHEIALLGWLNIVDPDRLMYGQFYSNAPLNWEKYSNPDLDKQLDLGRSSLDLNARKDAYQKAAAIIAKDLPYYVVSYQGYQAFWSKAVGPFDVNPRGALRSLIQIGKK